MKSIGLNRRKVGRDECLNPSVKNIERQKDEEQISDDKSQKSDSDQSMGSTADSLDSHSSEGTYSGLLN